MVLFSGGDSNVKKSLDPNGILAPVKSGIR